MAYRPVDRARSAGPARGVFVFRLSPQPGASGDRRPTQLAGQPQIRLHYRGSLRNTHRQSDGYGSLDAQAFRAPAERCCEP